jgi:hypothetical protein
MATEKQIAANRRNAKRSTGPRTDRGKTIARVNAIKHGLRAEAIEVLPGEDAEAFRGLMIGLVDEYRPETPTQEHLVRRAAKLMWKEQRADRHEMMLEGRLFTKIETGASEIEKSTYDLFQMLTNQRRYTGALQRDLDRTFDAIRKNRLEHELRDEFEEEWAVEADAPNEPNFDVISGTENDSDAREARLELTVPAASRAVESKIGPSDANMELAVAKLASMIRNAPSEAILDFGGSDDSRAVEPEISASEANPELAVSNVPSPTRNAPNEANSEAAPDQNRQARRARAAKKRKRLLQKAARKAQSKS